MLSAATRDVIWLCYYGTTLRRKIAKAAAIAAERAATVDPELRRTVRLSVPNWCFWCILFDVWVRKEMAAWPLYVDPVVPVARKHTLWLGQDGQLYTMRASKGGARRYAKRLNLETLDRKRLDRKSLTELHHVLSRDFIRTLRSDE